MSDYEVQVDIVLSGSLYIDSSSEKEARDMARKILENVNSPDFLAFSCIHKEIIDVWKL